VQVEPENPAVQVEPDLVPVVARTLDRGVEVAVGPAACQQIEVAAEVTPSADVAHREAAAAVVSVVAAWADTRHARQAAEAAAAWAAVGAAAAVDAAAAADAGDNQH
jgi:hypothetical protein